MNRLHTIVLEQAELYGSLMYQQAASGVPDVEFKLIPPDPLAGCSEEDVEAAVAVCEEWADQENADSSDEKVKVPHSKVNAVLHLELARRALADGGAVVVLRGPDGFVYDYRDELQRVIDEHTTRWGTQG